MAQIFFARRIGFAIGVAMLAGIAIAASGQTQPTAASDAQSFEVAMFRLEDPNTTVDYNRPDAPNQSNRFPTNRYTFFHTGLKSLIATAYGVPYNTILGGPGWLDSQHYDLSAKVEGDARLTLEQMRPMFRNLLKERVKLAVHSERRIVKGYALVIAKGGSKLKPNTGAPFYGQMGLDIRFRNAPLTSLAQAIGHVLKQPVVEKTGLGGVYDFDLIHTPDDVPNGTLQPDFGFIFNDIQEQLGLKLVPQKVPVDYLVIDHVERVPTAN